jgi:hypothetical protein
MRRRRKARMNYHNKSIKHNLDIETNSPCLAPEHKTRQRKKEINPITVIQCEGIFFCNVIQRLTKEIECAHNLNDLAHIITLAAKFIQASADKEKALALSLATSKNSEDPEKMCTYEADDLNNELGAEE